jgi:uncharacterized protein
MKLFFDASAFVKRYVQEAGSDAVESLCGAADDIALSIICPVEILSAAKRLQREGRISARQYENIKNEMLADVRDITLVQIDAAAIRESVVAIESLPLKALDSIHIGCALQCKPDFFISSDLQQIAAARKMGLRVRHV